MYYLGPDDTDLLETQRVIQQVLRPGLTQVPKLAWSNSDRHMVVSLVPVVVGSRLSMLSRKRQWSRWSSPQGEDLPKNMKEREQLYVTQCLRGSLTLTNSSDMDSTNTNSSKDTTVRPGFRKLYSLEADMR